ALLAGAHVLCEKPLTVTLSDADRLLATAKRVGRLLLVDHQFRINPRSQAALRLMKEGAIGPVRSICCTGKGRHAGWELVETGTHLFDLAMLFGGTAQWVSANLFVGDRLATEDDIVERPPGVRNLTGHVVGDRAHVSVGFDSGAVLR